MSDYTPSTDEVRADYVRDHTRNFDSYMTGRSLTSEQEVYGARYDRMIESVRAEERERIARNIEALEHTRDEVRDRIRGGFSVDWSSGFDSAVADAARVAREGA